MAKFRTDGDTVVDAEKATTVDRDDTFWDGRNHISKPTGSEWNSARRSRQGGAGE
jgi:hypothetical protein